MIIHLIKKNMKLSFNLKSVLSQALICKILIIFQLAQYIRSDCNKTHPILKNNECGSIYCSQQDYNSLICIVNNSIAKIQWLTNIIPISNLKFRYIHPFLTKNKDLIIQTTSVLGTAERRYYGLTNEGRYYFIIQLKQKEVMKIYLNMKVQQLLFNLKMKIMIIF